MKIKKITKKPPVPTVDIEVENTHSYQLSNGWVSHNTLSLLPGVTPGVHPNPAGPYYIRRIRMAANSPLIQTCINHGYNVEYQRNFDGTDDKTTMVVEFPCKVPENTPIAANFSWRDQLDNIRRLQREWSDNSVSCTIYYRKEDLEDIKEYLDKHFAEEIKTVSFLLYNDHGFQQAPYETITKERYEEMIVKCKPITNVEIKEDQFEIEECQSGVCPIK